MARPTTPAPMTTVSTSSTALLSRFGGDMSAPDLLAYLRQGDGTGQQDGDGIDAGCTDDQDQHAADAAGIAFAKPGFDRRDREPESNTHRCGAQQQSRQCPLQSGIGA